MAKIKTLNLEITDFEKITIKNFKSKLTVSVKKKKPKRELKNWYKKLGEFIDEKNN